MSKHAQPILRALLFAAVVAGVAANVPARSLDVTITIEPAAAKASVSGRFAVDGESSSELGFALPAAAFSPSDRISNVRLFDAGGSNVAFRRFNATSFVGERPFVSFSYVVDLGPQPNARSAAHASWLTSSGGLLFLDDVLPAFGRSVRMLVSAPTGWEVIAGEGKDATGKFVIEDISREVVMIGPAIRRSSERGTTLATWGKWHFSDEDAVRNASEIFGEYRAVFGSFPGERRQIFIIPFPQKGVPAGTWEAETRGDTVVLVSADTPFPAQSMQRLSEQLRHELFHLWFPNGVALTGRYDWFFEGFALYQALKTGVALNQIRFADFLDTLSRAYTIDRAQKTGRRSLVEMSAARFAGGETQLYARGMVAAFLIDVTLLEQSGGRRSVASLLRQLFADHKRPAAAVDGNKAVLSAMAKFPEAGLLPETLVRGNGPIDWSREIAFAGLEDDGDNFVSALRVKTDPSRRQSALLDKLGYNNWRRARTR